MLPFESQYVQGIQIQSANIIPLRAKGVREVTNLTERKLIYDFLAGNSYPNCCVSWPACACVRMVESHQKHTKMSKNCFQPCECMRKNVLAGWNTQHLTCIAGECPVLYAIIGFKQTKVTYFSNSVSEKYMTRDAL